ncbi:hypothetical protein ACWIUH_12200 [Ursidibacter arcticus]
MRRNGFISCLITLTFLYLICYIILFSIYISIDLFVGGKPFGMVEVGKIVKLSLMMSAIIMLALIYKYFWRS